MVGEVAITSANGAEGEVEGAWILGVSPGGMPCYCRERVGAKESGDVEVL